MSALPNVADWLSLRGKVAHVTGGGHGIGRGIATALAAAGATVVVSDVDPARAEAVAAEIRGTGVRLDVADGPAVDAAMAATVARHGRLDVLVNNAGVFDGLGVSVLDFTDEQWRRVMAINLDGVFQASRAASRLMRAKGDGAGGGRIVNIASTQAYTAGAGIAYDAAKAAVVQMTRALALDLGRYGINVNAIAPGPIWNKDEPRPETGFGMPPEGPGLSGNPMLDSISNHMARLPYGKWGTPLDIGKAALFLASDMSPMVTGAVLAVDGGWLTL